MCCLSLSVYAGAVKHATQHKVRASKAAQVSQVQEPVDINKADEGTLQQVKGIGPKRARAIVEYRTAHGPFKSIDDLKNVKGIGIKRLTKIIEHLTV
ncbi:MAG: helix-hairpin-helix domain-containing protein [Gammaproteobacteria bacterium]|nr:helix-hairpin-helix domain-containing protein [Gammaproteobacteria bacterium]